MNFHVFIYLFFLYFSCISNVVFSVARFILNSSDEDKNNYLRTVYTMLYKDKLILEMVYLFFVFFDAMNTTIGHWSMQKGSW